MKTNSDFDIAKETSRLLSELDQVINHSSALRDIVKRREQLYDLECLTGPSPKTLSMRREIMHLEQQLRDDRAALDTTLETTLETAMDTDSEVILSTA